MKNNIIKLVLAIMIAFAFTSCTKEDPDCIYNKKIEYSYTFYNEAQNIFTNINGISILTIDKISSNSTEQQYKCELSIRNDDGKYVILTEYGTSDDIKELFIRKLDTFVTHFTTTRYDYNNKKCLQFKNPGYNTIGWTTNVNTNENIKFNNINVFKNYILNININ